MRRPLTSCTATRANVALKWRPCVLQQDLPYSSSERGKAIKLAADIAAEGKRPPIRENWNPAISFLIASCWSDDVALRPSPGQIMSSLEQIMGGKQGLITSLTDGRPIPSKKDADVYLAPGALWRKIQIKRENIELGEVLGQGSYSTVYECHFQNKRTALKMFRNAIAEKAFKEIEITFSMRHPNIIGIYAWLQEEGQMLTQIGMVIELADGGDLMGLYTKKGEGQEYSFKLGLEIVLGAAKGLAHMHSMPTPVVHRDVKSGNILIVNDENARRKVGKIADCGESRRVDLDSTMTRTGSPLWAAVSNAEEHFVSTVVAITHAIAT